MRLAHHPQAVATLRTPGPSDPWRVLLSGCMAGWGCGVDGTSYGMAEAAPAWLQGPLVQVLPFCPEEAALGVPRPMPDCDGGDGRDVLAGRARVLGDAGEDLTAAMMGGAAAMVAFAKEHDVDFAVLTDASAACGTQVLSLGSRFATPQRRQRGMGVAAAGLVAAGFPVVSQRDHRTLALLAQRIDPTAPVDPTLRDHHEHPWVVANLPV